MKKLLKRINYRWEDTPAYAAHITLSKWWTGESIAMKIGTIVVLLILAQLVWHTAIEWR